MKSGLKLGVFSVLVIFLSCGKQQDVLFEIPMILRFDVGAGLSPFERHFYLVRKVPTNITALKGQFNSSSGNELIIRPASAIMSSVLQNVDLNYIQEVVVSVYDEDPDDATDLFFTNQVPGNAGSNLLVVPLDFDVREFVDKDLLNFKISLLFRSITPATIEATMEINFTAE